MISKKLEHIVDSMISPFLKDKYPLWEEFIKGYFTYLDQNFFGKIINLTDNNNPFEIYSELVDDFFNTYFKGVINIEKYGLTDTNKRLFISLSKFIAGLKGNKNGFEFLFKSLTDFRFPGEGGDVNIDKISVEYAEDENWWKPGNIPYAPYTYKFILDQAQDVMEELIESVHPAGFLYDFVSGNHFEDTQGIEDEITMTMGKINAYDGEYLYDGSIVYGDDIIETITF